MAIDSNKRDRRHSETVEFMSPQIATCRAELEQGIVTPATHTVTAAQGLQLISSPTVAIPQGSLPPYSGGFILTPGGTHMVAPHLATSPQILQMTTHPSGIPLMLSAPTAKSNPGSDNGEDSHESSEHSEPPAKRIALDSGQVKVSAASSRVSNLPQHTASFIMTPSGTHMVQAPQLSSPTPQLFQMTTHPHIPLVIPTSGQVSSPTESRSSTESGPTSSGGGGAEKKSTHQASRSGHPIENGLPLATVTPHSMVLTPRGTQVVPSAQLSSPQVVQLPTPSHLPFMIPAMQGHSIERKRGGETGEEHLQGPKSEPAEKPAVTSSKIPFANISIQSG